MDLFGKKKKNNESKTEVEAVGAIDAAGVPVSAVGWNDESGVVTVGGKSYTPTKTPSGRAWVGEDEFSEGIDEYKKSTGIKSGAELDEVYNKNTDSINTLSDKLVNTEQWSYDPEKDEAFKAYRESVLRDGAKAFKNILAEYAAKTGGNINSAGLSAAAEGYNSYLSGILDRLPTFQGQSFNRYVTENELTREAIDSLLERAKSDFSVAKESSEYAKDTATQNGRLQNERVDKAQERVDHEYDREDKALDRRIKQVSADYAERNAENKALIDEGKIENNNLDNEYKTRQIKKADRDITGKEYDLEQKQIEKQARELEFQKNVRDYYVQNALSRGHFTSEEADYLGIEKDTNVVEYYNKLYVSKTATQIADALSMFVFGR